MGTPPTPWRTVADRRTCAPPFTPQRLPNRLGDGRSPLTGARRPDYNFSCPAHPLGPPSRMTARRDANGAALMRDGPRCPHPPHTHLAPFPPPAGATSPSSAARPAASAPHSSASACPPPASPT